MAATGDSLRAAEVEVDCVALVFDKARSLKEQLGAVGAKLGNKGSVLRASREELVAVFCALAHHSTCR